MHAQDHFVGLPIGKEVHAACNHKRDHGTSGAADEIADSHEKCREGSEERSGFDRVHGLVSGTSDGLTGGQAGIVLVICEARASPSSNEI